MCPPDMFPKAWAAVKASWQGKGWDKWLEYFESTWVEKFPGWNVEFLGMLAPRANGGLEGQWPLLHRIIKGVVTVRTMIGQMHEFLIPHYVEEGGRTRKPLPPSVKNLRCLTLRNRQEAVRLLHQTNHRAFA